MTERYVPKGFRLHTNPDGSPGGVVHESTVVDEGAYIAPNAIVEDGAHVLATDRIDNGVLLTIDRAMIKLGRNNYRPKPLF